MPTLKNNKHERFAQGLAKGLTAEDAYKKAGYKPDRGNATRLTANDNVKDRVAELQGKAADGTVYDLNRTLLYLESVLETPIAEVDPRHKLCQEYSESPGKFGTAVKYKMVGKLEALEKLIKLRGWYAPEKVTVGTDDALAEILAQVRAQ